MRYLSLCSGVEAASVAWKGLGWTPVTFSEVAPFPCSVLKHHFPDVPNLGDMTRIRGEVCRGSVDLLVGGTPCQGFFIAGKRGGWPTSAADWPCTLYGLWQRLSLSGFYGKTSPELFPLRQDGTSGHSSGRWMVSGIISHGECLTLSSSECPSAAVESSLSDILETGDIPQRFFLSPAACAGILRRAEKRGRTLPKPLQNALEQVALTITGHKPDSTSQK